tara:strand:+ start:4016 stop:4228 length:213 start_codon:yes stop_codon:yes gene_type:complete
MAGIIAIFGLCVMVIVGMLFIFGPFALLFFSKEQMSEDDAASYAVTCFVLMAAGGGLIFWAYDLAQKAGL